MNPDILIVRENNGFRLLHGQLHLTNMLCQLNETTVDVSGEGQAKVVKASHGFFVEKDGRRLPLRRD